MAATPTVQIPRAADQHSGLRQPDCINSRALAANVAETITIPAGATHVLYSCSDNFVAFAQQVKTAAIVPAAWPTDKDDGSQPGELNPTLRQLDPSHTHISVLSLNASVVTAGFFAKAGP